MEPLPQFLVDRLCDEGHAVSKSQARRLILQGGVLVDGEQAKDIGAEVPVRAKVEIKSRRRRS